jgi:hypothetical protein
VPQLFERWLVGRPLADLSRREYAPATSRSSRARSRTRGRRARHAAAGRHPARPALRDARRRVAEPGDGARRAHLGHRPGRRDDDRHRHLRARRRDQPPAARRAAATARARRRPGRQRAHRPARNPDRQGRPRPGGGARPAAGHAARHDAARLVLATRRAGAGVVSRLRRLDRRPRPAPAAEQPRPPVDRRLARAGDERLTRRAREPLQRARGPTADGVPQPAGGWTSPPTCGASPTLRSAPSPSRSATAARSPSAPPSSASPGSARSSTAPAHAQAQA